MVEYWFDKCYKGERVNPEMSTYDDEIITVLKFSKIYENCFIDL